MKQRYRIPNLIEDNKTKPVVDCKECILEKVYVETPVDTDGDGKLDLIAVYIRRPKETLDGFRVPAIYVANPYMMTCNEDWYIPHQVDGDIKAYGEQEIEESQVRYDFSRSVEAIPVDERLTSGYVESAPCNEIPPFEAVSDMYAFFNSRGYATVFSAGLGTDDSEGITLTGSQEEVYGFKAVIDWLNGRCRAFTNRVDNVEVQAGWCTGNVAMSAKSYLGTMCIGVATTGVAGLKTIIPEAAISNWYEYYRSNGLTVPAMGWQGDDLDVLAKYCFSRRKSEDFLEVQDIFETSMEELLRGQDRASGNYNRFWDERNYLNQVDKIKASVFIIHGLRDWNVKTNQCIPFFAELQRLGKEAKMMLHLGGHIYIYNLLGGNLMCYLHKWLDHYLYELDNGAYEDIPNVMVQSNIDQNRWLLSREYPPEKSGIITFVGDKECKCDESYKTFLDDLELTPYRRDQDNIEDWQDDMILQTPEEGGYFLRFTEASGDGFRICGSPVVEFRSAVDRNVAVLSAMLVDYGCDSNYGDALVEFGEEHYWGKGSSAYKMGCFQEERSKGYQIITRGHLNSQNRTTNYSKNETVPNQYYDYTIEMIPTDYTVKSGHRLGLIIYGTDPSQTARQFVKTSISIATASLKWSVPIAL